MATAKKAAKKTTAKAAPKRMGRPPKPEAERRSLRLNLRVTAAERAWLHGLADAAGEEITTYVLTAAALRAKA